MPDLLTDALRQSTIATFENLAMMVAEATDDLPEEPWQPRVTSVRFDGGTDAWLELEVSQELLPEVAQCMLGHQGLISAAITDDVLGELANVIAGNLLAHL